MNILPKLFVPVFIFAAMMIQLVGEQIVYCSNPGSAWIHLHFGFPKQFLAVEGAENIPPLYDRFGDERTPKTSTRVPASIIIFSPYTCANPKGYGYFVQRRLSQELCPRKGIFLWEHTDFYRCEWSYWWDEITLEQYEKGESFWKTSWNSWNPLTVRYSEDYQRRAYDGASYDVYYRDVWMKNIPRRCMVFDAVYVGLVMASGLYLLFGDTYKKHTWRWDLFFIFTQIFVLFHVLSLINETLEHFAWIIFAHYYVDFCWFYTLLYAINIMAVVMVLFCVKDWIHAARKSGILKFRK